MLRVFSHTSAVLLFTLLTQIGGVAWLLALAFRRRVLAFLLVYATLSISSVWIAPQFGRVALNCFTSGPLQIQNMMYCALNRHYVSPELKTVLTDTAADMNRRFPGTQTLVLDANFPFLDGFPLLPHLSHDDGDKADLAFYYRDDTGYLPGITRSPIGYFAFEHGPTDCTPSWPTLRWNLIGLQSLWPIYDLDVARNTALLNILSSDKRVGRIFVEPHLQQAWNLSHPSIRFQGCRAARHDDHIHLQLQ